MPKEPTTPINVGKVIISWQMPEYPHHEKGKLWYVIAGILVLGLIIYGLITAEYTMAIVFALLAGVYYTLHTQPPRNIEITMTTLGILIDNSFHQYSNFKNFWIVYNPPHVKLLYLRSAKRIATDIRIELMEQNPVVIRQLLQTQMKELSGEEEPFSDKLTRIFKL